MVQGNTTIFVGGASQMEQLLAPAISDPMIATGNIGLYGHLTGVFDMVVNADMQALSALWAGTAPGVEENGVDTVVAKQTITIKNTTNAAIDVPVGATVSTASGISFTVLMDRRPDADWATGGPLGDGSWGHYVIAPGASITVTVEATQDGPAGNVLAGAITTIAGVPGAVITASTAEAVALQEGSGTVTLRNTTASAVVIASSDIVQGNAEVGEAGQYQVGRDPAVAGYQPLNADGSIWHYVVQPGATITVPIYSVAPAYAASTLNAVIEAMLAEDAPAGSITGGVNLPAGLVVHRLQRDCAGWPQRARAGRQFRPARTRHRRPDRHRATGADHRPGLCAPRKPTSTSTTRNSGRRLISPTGRPKSTHCVRTGS